MTTAEESWWEDPHSSRWKPDFTTVKTANDFTKKQLEQERVLSIAAEKMNPRLLDDPDFLLQVFRKAPPFFKYISQRLKESKEFVLAGLQHGANIYNCLSKEMSQDKDIVLAEVQRHGNYISFVSYIDEEIVDRALRDLSQRKPTNGLNQMFPQAFDRIYDHMFFALVELYERGIDINSRQCNFHEQVNQLRLYSWKRVVFLHHALGDDSNLLRCVLAFHESDLPGLARLQALAKTLDLFVSLMTPDQYDEFCTRNNKSVYPEGCGPDEKETSIESDEFLRAEAFSS